MRVRRWEQRSRSNVYWRVVKVCVGSIQYGVIETSCLLRYRNILSSKFIKILNYIKSLCIIFMLNGLKYFEQKIRKLLSKNISTPSDENMFQGGKIFQYPHIVYYSSDVRMTYEYIWVTYRWHANAYYDIWMT